MTCKWCGEGNVASVAPECDDCWELRQRIDREPELAKEMLAKRNELEWGSGLVVHAPSEAFIGPGGAPTRPITMPTDSAERKRRPVVSGVLDYFPDAILAVAELSMIGNDQHNPGQPLHWARSKSSDEADTCVRHLMERGKIDTDGVRHSTKAAWRALANLQKEIEADAKSLESKALQGG